MSASRWTHSGDGHSRLSNSGVISVDNADWSGLAMVNNMGTLSVAGNFNLSSTAFYNADGAWLKVQGGFTYRGERLDNAGHIVANNQYLQATTLVNRGWITGDTIRVVGSTLDNQGGTISSDSQLSLNMSETVDNTGGQLLSQGSLSVEGETIINHQGNIAAKQIAVLGGEDVSVSAKTIKGFDTAYPENHC